MSTVSDETICPKCNYKKAYFEINCRSGMELIICKRCGFNLYYDFNKEKYVEKIFKGAYYIEGKNGLGQGGSYKNNKFIEKFKKEIKENKEIIKAYYTKKINGKWYKVNVLTNKEGVFK